MISPYRDTLVDALAPEERLEELRVESRRWRSWSLTDRQICELELLLVGAYSPLHGFMGQQTYDRVCEQMRLEDGTLWPLPITLDVSEELARQLQPGERLALRDPEGVMLAALQVEQVWQPDREREAALLHGTSDPDHPVVEQRLRHAHPFTVGGPLEGVELPAHPDFRLLRHTPRELRAQLVKRGWRRVLAFQPDDVMHRPQLALTLRAAREHRANLLIHPTVSLAQTQDRAHFSRIRCLQLVLDHYPRHTVMLALRTGAGGPRSGLRDLLLQAIVQRNYGCSHLLVEAGLLQQLSDEHQHDLGIELVPAGELLYVEGLDDLVDLNEVPEGSTPLRFSQDDLHQRLERGRPIPSWFSFPEVIEELRRTRPPRHRQGFTVFFTGLPTAGKSTLAKVLMAKLLELGGRPVTLLDGDIVRRHLSSELTFSKEHRDINIRRIGFVASEITKNGGIAICAPIAPYARVRDDVRGMISDVGGFVLVHVSTPLEVCEARDRKGMYAKARAGVIKDFTGVSDPYEPPLDAELAIDTADASPEQCVQQILLFLQKEGYLAAQ